MSPCYSNWLEEWYNIRQFVTHLSMSTPCIVMINIKHGIILVDSLSVCCSVYSGCTVLVHSGIILVKLLSVIFVALCSNCTVEF